MWDHIRLEFSLQAQSRWTQVSALAVAVFLIGGVFLTSGFVKSMMPTLLSAQRAHGADFARWLAEDSEAAPFRNDIEAARPESGANIALSVLGALGPMIAAVWGASVLGGEFARGTARVKAVHYGWQHTVAIKMLVICAAACAVAVLAPLIGVAAGSISWWLLLSKAGWLGAVKAAVGWRIGLGVIVVCAGVGFYGLLAGGVALIARSMPAGIVAGIAIPYAESYIGAWWLPQSALANLLGRSLHYYPGAVVNAPPVSSQPPVWWLSIVVLAAYTVVVVLVTVAWSSRQEIP